VPLLTSGGLGRYFGIGYGLKNLVLFTSLGRAGIKLYCLVTEVHGYEQFAPSRYAATPWPEIEPPTTGLQVQCTAHRCHTQIQYQEKNKVTVIKLQLALMKVQYQHSGTELPLSSFCVSSLTVQGSHSRLARVSPGRPSQRIWCKMLSPLSNQQCQTTEGREPNSLIYLHHKMNMHRWAHNGNTTNIFTTWTAL